MLCPYFAYLCKRLRSRISNVQYFYIAGKWRNKKEKNKIIARKINIDSMIKKKLNGNMYFFKHVKVYYTGRLFEEKKKLDSTLFIL